MKIAFISTIHKLPYAGCEELWVRTAAHLARQGHQVEANVHYFPWPKEKMEALKQAGCRIHVRRQRTALSRAPRIVWHRFALNRKRPLDTFPGYRAARRWLSVMRPDLLVISQNLHVQGMQWVQLCADLKLRYVLVVQSAGECDWPEDEEAEILTRAFEGATGVFFVSHKNADLVRTQLAIGLPRAEVVRNPFNVSYTAQPAWPEPDGVWKLACPARLHPRSKGQDLILDVLRQPVWRHRPIKLSLYGDGPAEATLQKLAAAYELDNVVFRGSVTAVEQIWAEHHALILPSRYEGLPLAIIEAMLCGRMCIVTDVAGNAELVAEGVSGFVATAPMIVPLADAMERAWSRRQEWQAIGKVAAHRIRQLVPSNPETVFADKLLRLVAQ